MLPDFQEKKYIYKKNPEVLFRPLKINISIEQQIFHKGSLLN